MTKILQSEFFKEFNLSIDFSGYISGSRTGTKINGIKIANLILSELAQNENINFTPANIFSYKKDPNVEIVNNFFAAIVTYLINTILLFDYCKLDFSIVKEHLTAPTVQDINLNQYNLPNNIKDTLILKGPSNYLDIFSETINNYIACKYECSHIDLGIYEVDKSIDKIKLYDKRLETSARSKVLENELYKDFNIGIKISPNSLTFDKESDYQKTEELGYELKKELLQNHNLLEENLEQRTSKKIQLEMQKYIILISRAQSSYMLAYWEKDFQNSSVPPSAIFDCISIANIYSLATTYVPENNLHIVEGNDYYSEAKSWAEKINQQIEEFK